MALTKIGKMSLKNQGGFVCRIKFTWLDDNGEKQVTGDCSGDITLGFTKTADPGDCGVPDGSVVSLYAFVVWGRDNEARQFFLYEQGNPKTANYNISGTTLDNQLGLVSVE
jgi:hypothetical protein